MIGIAFPRLPARLCAWLPGCLAYLMRREVITHELQDDARLMRDRGEIVRLLLESEFHFQKVLKDICISHEEMG